MSVFTACISGSNLEDKMPAAMMACQDQMPAAGRALDGECPTFEDVVGHLHAEFAGHACMLSSLGWVDENGQEDNATIAADLGTLNPAVTAQLSEEVIGQCVMAVLERMSSNPTHEQCANNFDKHQMADIQELAIKMATMECFADTLQTACKEYVMQSTAAGK